MTPCALKTSILNGIKAASPLAFYCECVINRPSWIKACLYCTSAHWDLYVKQMHSYKSGCHKQQIILFSTSAPIHHVHNRFNQALLFISIQAFRSWNTGSFRDRAHRGNVVRLGARDRVEKKKKGERDMLSWTIKSSKETLSFYFSLSLSLSLSLTHTHTLYPLCVSQYIFSFPCLHGTDLCTLLMLSIWDTTAHAAYRRREHEAADEWSILPSSLKVHTPSLHLSLSL